MQPIQILIKVAVIDTGVGQSHSQSTMQNSSTKVSAVCFSVEMILELGGDFVLLINCSSRVSVFTTNLK